MTITTDAATQQPVAAAAAAWQAAGVSVVPTRLDGTKAPAGAWKTYTTTPATGEQVTAWYTDPRQTGVGLVCGAVSGGLEMLELEGRAVAAGLLQQLRDLVHAAGLGDLWQRLTNGYAEWTPSGGLHLLYRVDGAPVPGNTKLARRPGPADPATGKPTVEVLAETRGEGGYVVVAPSCGTVHPTGQAWTLIAGQAGHLPTITTQERADLHRVVRLLDQQPTPETDAAPASPFAAPARPAPPDGHVSPGDDFEAKVDWDDQLLLGGAGWRRIIGQPGGYRTWLRPGKDRGISATTGQDPARDRLYVFSTSTVFDAETPYTKLGAYAVLHHGGDHSAAARALQQLGYGTQRPHEPAPASLSALSAPALPPGLTPPAEATPAPLDRLRAALLDSRGLDNIPEPAPLINGVLYLDSVAWLIGPPGNGKSFVALDMAGCIGTGQIWQSFPTIAGPVLYLIAEGATGIKQRVRAWEKSMGKEMAGVQFLPVAVQSSNDSDWNAFIALAAELRPSLVVVDTQARVTVGLEENSARDMGTFVHRVEQLRIGSGACVLIIHHTGRAGDHMRGSTAMEGAATTIIKVTKDEDNLEVECDKQKDAPAFEPFKLRLVTSGSSAIVTLNDHGPVVHSGQPAVKRLLTEWWECHESEWVSVSTLIKSKVTTEPTFHRTKKALLKAGLIEARGEGVGRRYRMPRPTDSHGLSPTLTRASTTTLTLSPPFRGESDESASPIGATFNPPGSHP